MATTNFTEEILTAALEGLEARRQRIQETEAEVRRLMGGAIPSSSGVTHEGGRRVMSAETRARMAQAQRRRWAKTRGESPVAAKAAPKAGKRKLSAAGRKAISEAAKKRWAAIRAAA